MKEAFKNSFTQLRDTIQSQPHFLLMTFLLGLFGFWNGMQFLVYTSHFYTLMSESSLNMFMLDLTGNFYSFLPSSIFIVASLLVCYWFLHILAEIFLIDIFKQKLKLSEKFTLFFNFSIPSFFILLFVLFLIFTLILLTLIVYLFLVSFGLDFSVKLLMVLVKFFKVLIYSCFLLSFVLKDFVLYFHYSGHSYIKSLKLTYQLIKQNFVDFLQYLIIKYIFILGSMIVLFLLLKLFVMPINQFSWLAELYRNVYELKMMGIWQDFFINSKRILTAASISVILFSFSTMLLYPFNRLLIWNMFNFDVITSQAENEIETNHLPEEEMLVEKEESNDETEE